MTLADRIKDEVPIVDLCRRIWEEPDRSGFVHSLSNKDDHTPSLKLYPETNTYKDYSVGDKAKSVIDFYMERYNIQQCDFALAITELAKLYGYPVDQENKGSYTRSEEPVKSEFFEIDELIPNKIIEVMTSFEAELFWEQFGKVTEQFPGKLHAENKQLVLNQVDSSLNEVRKVRLKTNTAVFHALARYCINKGWDDAAMRYLRHDRGIPEQVIQKFHLFCIKNYSEVNNHLKKEFNKEQLQKSGLYNSKTENDKEKFNLMFYNHRIVIPYMYRDSMVYLRARYFDKDGSSKPDDPKAQKYLGLKNDLLNVNTPKRFFNMDVLDTNIPGKKLYIVEGEFDAVVLEAFNYYAVAIPGATNIPGNKLLKKLEKFEVVLCGDNDTPGNTLMDELETRLVDVVKALYRKSLQDKDVNDFFKNKMAS